MNFKFNHMKAIVSLLMAFLVSVSLNAQEPDSVKKENGPDTTNFMLGKKEISIIEKNGETDIKVRDRNEKDDDEFSKEKETFENEHEFDWNKKRSGNHFKGHWDAFQIGINSYLTADKSTSLPQEMNFMSLNTNKSINVNLNFLQQSFGIIGRSFGIMSGLGLEFTNYVFDGDNTIEVNADGNIISSVPGYKLDKSKLSTTYLTVPLLLEFQFPGERRSNRLYINGGVIGGVKLGSHTKIKYKENGDKQDKKNKDDFNLNSLRYGFTGRIGIKHLSIYGTYYPVSLFEKGKGPELYPFMIGFSFDGF